MIAVKTFSIDKLKTMHNKRLAKIAESLGIEAYKYPVRADLLAAVLAAQEASGLPDEAAYRAAADEEFKRRNPEFEQLADINAEPSEEGEAKKQRGGYRPGAGRPKGSTAEICAVRSLPEQPNEAVKASLEALFMLWAIKSGVEEVKLTQEEAVKIALPVTQIMSLNNLEIPQSAHIYIMAIWTAWEVTASKIAIIQAKRKDILEPVNNE